MRSVYDRVGCRPQRADSAADPRGTRRQAPALSAAAGAAALSLLVFPTVSTRAADVTWDNDSGDFRWDTPANWSTNTLPGPLDRALFTGSGVGTVDLGGNVRGVNSVVFSNQGVSGYTLGNGTLRVSSIHQRDDAPNVIAAAVEAAGASVSVNNNSNVLIAFTGPIRADTLRCLSFNTGLRLSAPSPFLRDVAVGEGVVVLGASNVLPADARIGAGEDGEFNLAGYNLTVASLAGGPYGFFRFGGGTLTVAARGPENFSEMALYGDGGGLRFVGPDATAFVQRAGLLEVAAGATALSVAAGSGGTATVAFGSDVYSTALSRSAGATLDVAATRLGDTERVTFTDPNGIDPVPDGPLDVWVTTNGTDFAKYDSVRGVLPFATADYSPTLTASADVKLRSAAISPTSLSVSTLNLDASAGAVGVTGAEGTVLSLARGGLLKSGAQPATVSGGVLTSGTDELIVHSYGGDLRIDAAVTGTDLSVVKSGTGKLVLGGARPNAYAGTTYVNQGVLELAKPAGVDAVSRRVVVSGGTLRPASAEQIPDGAAVTVRAGSLVVDAVNETFTTLTTGEFFSYAPGGAVHVHGGGVLRVAQAELRTGSLVAEGGGRIQAGSLVLHGGSVGGSAGGVVEGHTVSVSRAGTAVRPGGVLSVGPGGLTLADLAGHVLTLDADAVAPGLLKLGGDVRVTGRAAVLASEPVQAGQTAGTIDLGGVARAFRVEDVSPGADDLNVSARLLNGKVVKEGAGTLALSSAASAFAGGLEVNDGAVVIAAPARFGGGVVVNRGSTTIAAPAPFSGGVEVRGGTVTVASPAPFTGGVRLTRSGTTFGTLVVTSDQDLGNASNGVAFSGGLLRVAGTFSTARSITLGDDAGNGDGKFEITAGGTLSVNSAMSGLAGLEKVGPGTLVLRAANAYTGQTVVREGVLRLGPGGSVGASLYPVEILPGATLELSNSAARGLRGLRGTGSVVLGGSSLRLDDGGTTNAFPGSVSGPGGLVKAGPGAATFSGPLSFTGGGVRVEQGTLTLAGPNTFTGGVTVQSGGRLSVSADQHLGPASNLVVLEGGTFHSAGGFTTARNLFVTSAGGAVEVDPGKAMTLSPAAVLSGSGPLAVSGGGELRVQAEAGLSGPVTVRDGTVALAGGNGAMRDVPSFSLQSDGVLLLDDRPGAGGGHLRNDRLGDSAVVFGQGGRLRLAGADGAPSVEVLGGLQLVSGTTTVALEAGAGGSAVELHVASLQRVPGALLVFGAAGGSERLLIDGQPEGFVRGLIVDMGGGTGPQPAAYDRELGLIPNETFNALRGLPAGARYVSPAATATVPEPATGLACLLLSAAGVLTRRRRIGTCRAEAAACG